MLVYPKNVVYILFSRREPDSRGFSIGVLYLCKASLSKAPMLIAEFRYLMLLLELLKVLPTLLITLYLDSVGVVGSREAAIYVNEED